MSSHHFVKEGQEPALLICDAADQNTLEPLLEWSPLVMVFDQVLEEFISRGIKIDVVITGSPQADSIKELLREHSPVTILVHPCIKDQLEIAFNFLLSDKQTQIHHVNVVAKESSGMFDAIQHHAGGLKVTLMMANTKWSLITGGSFSKWLPAGGTLSLRLKAPVYQSDGREVKENFFRADKDSLYGLHSNAPFWVGEVF